KEYPDILTPDNIWIIGIAQEPSTREYYLVFYHDVHAILDKFMRIYEARTFIGSRVRLKYMQYTDFEEIEKIGAGGYGTVYTAKYRLFKKLVGKPESVVLKRFNDFDEK